MNNLIIENTNENNLFSNSQVNLFSMIQYFTVLPVNEGKNNEFVIWFSSSNQYDSRILILTIFCNGKEILNETHKITDNFKFYKLYKYNENDKYEITCKIINNINETLKIKTININSYDDIINNGIFTIKNTGKINYKSNYNTKIGVVTKIKNMSEFLDIFYESLLNQTYTNWEWYILNNNSTDNLIEKIKKYNNHRIHIIPLDNYINSWEVATNNINSDILVAIDADDFITSNCLEEIIYCMEKDNLDFYCGSSIKFNSLNNILEEKYPTILKETYDINITHPLAFRRKFAKKIFSQYKIEFPFTDDYEFCNLMKCLNGKYTISDNITYFYRVNDYKSLSTSSGNLTDYWLYPTWKQAEDGVFEKINNIQKSLGIKNNLVEYKNYSSLINIEEEFEYLINYKFNIKNLNINYDKNENKLNFLYEKSHSLEIKNYKIIICDLDSTLPIYSFITDIQNGFWAIPFKEKLYEKYEENLRGYLIKVYDENNNFVGQKEIICDENKINNYNIKYWHNPYDAVINSYIDFMYNDIYEDFIDNCKIVIDAGANIGTFIQYLMKKNKNIEKVIFIEPFQENFQNIKMTFDPFINLEGYNNALYNTSNEDIVLYYEKNKSTSISVIEKENLNEMIVKTINLNDILMKYERIDLLKLDVESAEYKIFESLSNENLNKINKIIIEYHNNIDEVNKYILPKLKENNYLCSSTPDFKNIINSQNNYQGTFFAKKIKVRAIHLKTNPNEERELQSEKNIKQLENYGIEYIQIINNIYKGLPPKENCARPEDVQMEPGFYKLTPGHYGCYLAHKNGILSNFIDDIDILLIFECDAIILDINLFIKKVYEAYENCIKDDLLMWTFGPNYGYNIEEKENYHIINHFIETHSYMIPKHSKQKFIDKFNNADWDTIDLFYANEFDKVPQGVFKGPPLSLQHEGFSLLDKKFSSENSLGIKKITK